MKRLNTTWIKNPPSWADWIDCRQVGKDHNGNIMAYDYGY